METVETGITHFAWETFTKTTHLSDSQFEAAVDLMRKHRTHLEKAKKVEREYRKADPTMLEIARREIEAHDPLGLDGLDEINLLDDEPASYPGRS